ncbi:MAG: FAD:protein FMN transferase [Steroidobacteraceae bacterium]
MSSDVRLVHRAQVWLGTLVEVRASARAGHDSAAQQAVDAAFAEIADVHRLLSRQQGGRDWQAISEARPGRIVRVDPRTVEVLQLALSLVGQTGGRFDPDRSAYFEGDSRTGAAWCIEDSDTVRILRRGRLDLDGIAKGYAVDRAVDRLSRYGLACVVNAGGDMRSRGFPPQPMHLRSSLLPGQLLDLGSVTDCAVATSESRPERAGALPLASAGIEDPRCARRVLERRTVCVLATRCAVADALTKVVAVDPDGATPVLAAHGAVAWIVEEAESSPRLMRYGAGDHDLAA